MTLSYFEFQCNKLNFLKKYLHYLYPPRLEIALLLCKPNMKKQDICKFLNETRNFEMTPSRLMKRRHDIASTLFSLHNHAEIFGIEKAIVEKTEEELQKIVDDFYKKEKEKDND